MGKKKSNSVTARSGRFAGGPAAEANAFTNSVKFDTRLAHHDIAGSIAHARMLHHVGLLKKSEMEAIVDGLHAVSLRVLLHQIQFPHLITPGGGVGGIRFLETELFV